MAQQHCPMCDGPAAFMGALGHTKHFRCIDCGWTFSKTRKARLPVARQATAQERIAFHARLALAAGAALRFEVQ